MLIHISIYFFPGARVSTGTPHEHSSSLNTRDKPVHKRLILYSTYPSTHSIPKPILSSVIRLPSLPSLKHAAGRVGA
jgi:hypothetical protein